MVILWGRKQIFGSVAQPRAHRPWVLECAFWFAPWTFWEKPISKVAHLMFCGFFSIFSFFLFVFCILSFGFVDDRVS